MTTNDLFNTINDIDTKYVTDAWNNTEPETDTMVIYESTKTSKVKIFGVVAAFAALISAACLAVYIRVNELPQGNITPPDSGSVGSSNPTGITVDRSADLPVELFGPDYVRIKYGDVTGVTLPDGKAVAAESFDPDNWETIVCDGFTYLEVPSGNGCTNAQYPSADPLIFEENGDDLFPDFFPRNKGYRRFNVGDKYGNLTVKSAMTIFKNNSSTAASKLWECIVEFDGSVSINAYIVRDIEKSRGAMLCVPMRFDCSLPVMFPMLNGSGDEFVNKAYFGEYLSGEFKYRSEYPSFYLENDNNYYLANVFTDKDYAAVTLKISDVRMDCCPWTNCYDYIRAVIDEIRDYSGEPPEGALPFELVGLDGKQILFDDVDDIMDENMNAILPDNLTADNWYQIWCDGLCYLGAPTGKNHNSIDNYYSFDSDGRFAYSVNMHRYDRYNVGESFNGLRIASAMTVFSRTAEHIPGGAAQDELPMAQKLCLSYVALDGQAKLGAYLTRDGEGNISCIPLFGETALPVLFPGYDSYSSRELSGCFNSADGTKLYYNTELPRIDLDNSNGLDLSEYFGDKDYARVYLTLDNITLIYVRDVEQNNCIRAEIRSVAAYDSSGGNDITGVLPFELIGADGKQLRYEDIASATDKYNRTIKLTELTADNWQFIKCNFAYLAEANGITFKRYGVGDMISGLTVTAAEANFRNDSGNGNAAQKYLGSTASFGGVLEIDTYLAMCGSSFYCVNTGLPTAKVDKEALRRGSFVPVKSEPAFSPVNGFSTDDPEFGTPSLEVDIKVIKEMSSQLLSGEVIPVTASLSNVTIDLYGDKITADIYKIERR